MLDFSHIQQRIKKPTTKANSQRAAEIEPFVIRLNNSRIAGGYKALTPSYYASKMSHIDTDDLPAFYKKLEGGKNFSSLWYYYCCPKKKTGEK